MKTVAGATIYNMALPGPGENLYATSLLALHSFIIKHVAMMVTARDEADAEQKALTYAKQHFPAPEYSRWDVSVTLVMLP